MPCCPSECSSSSSSLLLPKQGVTAPPPPQAVISTTTTKKQVVDPSSVTAAAGANDSCGSIGNCCGGNGGRGGSSSTTTTPNLLLPPPPPTSSSTPPPPSPQGRTEGGNDEKDNSNGGRYDTSPSSSSSSASGGGSGTITQPLLLKLGGGLSPFRKESKGGHGRGKKENTTKNGFGGGGGGGGNITDGGSSGNNNPTGAASASTTTTTMQGPLNQSTNVLLVYRLQTMRGSANLNFFLAVLCLAYCSINITLLYITFVRHTTAHRPSGYTFHLLEFWATFVFAVVTCVSLVATPKSIRTIYDNPLVLKLIVFFNVVATFIPALLVTLSLDFEVPSHEIEYLNEITMSFIDLVLLWSLWKRGSVGNSGGNNYYSNTPPAAAALDVPSGGGNDLVVNSKEDETGKWTSFLLAMTATLVAVLQLGIYNLMGRKASGDMAGEVPAHYCEFTFEFLSSLITFWFCMDNKFVADREIGRILYGRHDSNCNICADQSVQFQQTYREGQCYPPNTPGAGRAGVDDGCTPAPGASVKWVLADSTYSYYGAV